MPYEEEDEEERRRRQALRPRRVTEPAAVEELAAPGVIDLRPLPVQTGPYVPPSENGTLPNMRVDGRNIFRPELNNTGDQLADVQEYRRQLEGYTDPKARDHWAVAVLKKGLQGAATGARATGTLQGALGGAVTGGLYGGFKPYSTEIDWREAEKQRAAGLEQQETARRGTQLDFGAKLADIGYKQARAAYEDVRPELERERNEGNLKRIEAGITQGFERLKQGDRRLDQGDERIKLTRSAQESLRDRSAANLKYRKEKDVLDRAERREFHSDAMRQRQAELAERVRARVQAERDKVTASGQRARAIRISEARARVWAKDLGFETDFDAFIDALDENDIQLKDD